MAMPQWDKKASKEDLAALAEGEAASQGGPKEPTPPERGVDSAPIDERDNQK